MDYINAIIFGIVQGLTEFLPISSSGHLVIIHKLINLPINNELAFDVVLHLATLIAVLLFFKKDIWLLLKSWLKSFKGEKDDLSKISWLIILGTIPAAIAGYFLDDLVESKFRSPLVVAIMLIVVGILFIIIEKYSKKIQDMNNLNWRKSLVIGIAQAIALIPGTSRSGITIIAGLWSGLKREVAIKFSFLLSIPIILGAVIKKIPQINSGFSGDEFGILLVAFIFSFTTGFFTIKYFLRFAKTHTLNIFAIYRFILAGILLLCIFGA